MIAKLDDVIRLLEEIAPPHLAEEWDNVGLLVGDPSRDVGRVMTCLTVTPDTAAEAIQRRADLIVTHHPLPFRPLKRLTTETTVGRLLLELIAAGTAVYSAHTAFDSAAEGINARLAAGLKLNDVGPLITTAPATDAGQPAAPSLGTGRLGTLAEPITLDELAERLKTFLGVGKLRCVGPGDCSVRRVAIGCGAAGSLLDETVAANCQAMVLGEASFHTCLEAQARHMGLLLPGHYASERFALEWLAERLAEKLPGLDVWSSRRERDPIRWLD